MVGNQRSLETTSRRRTAGDSRLRDASCHGRYKASTAQNERTVTLGHVRHLGKRLTIARSTPSHQRRPIISMWPDIWFRMSVRGGSDTIGSDDPIRRTCSTLRTPSRRGVSRLSGQASKSRLVDTPRRVCELASGLTRNQVSRKGLGVRVPCPPLSWKPLLGMHLRIDGGVGWVRISQAIFSQM